jgi:hypothetical protein
MTNRTLSNSLTDLAFRIRAEHEAATIATTRSLHHAMQAGELLLEAKEQLKHGQWTPWLKQHCNIPDRTARLYMRLSKRLKANWQSVADLTIQAAIRLLREVDDLRETHDRLTEKFWHLHNTREEEYGTRSGPLSKAEAEKITRTLGEMFHLSWLVCETCLRLGVHIVLGLTQDEWWLKVYSHLGDDDIAVWMRDAFEACRRELDYDEMVETAI